MKNWLEFVKGDFHEGETKSEPLEGSNSTTLRETRDSIKIFISEVVHITIIKWI